MYVRGFIKKNDWLEHILKIALLANKNPALFCFPNILDDLFYSTVILHDIDVYIDVRIRFTSYSLN